MTIILMYSVITEEGTVIPNITERFECDETDESRTPARNRLKELKTKEFIANLQYKIEETEEEHIVTVAFKTYDYKVKGPVKKGQYVTVLSNGHPVKLKVLEVDPREIPGMQYAYAKRK